MPTLSQAKSLGAVGSILVILSAVPSVGALLGIVGFVLMLVAIRDISEAVGDRSIFSNMLVAVGLAIVGIIVGALVVVGSVLRFVGLNNLNFGPNYSFNPATVPTGDWVALIGSVIIGLVVVWVMMLASAIYVRRTYRSISLKLNVSMFETAGLVYLIGAATTIILVGFLLLFIAQILVVVAFFSIEERRT
jgi:uncharacterized membrane protein